MTTEPAGARPDAFELKPYWQTLLVILLIALWPFAIVYFASSIADLNACTIVVSGPTPCIVLGSDLGQLLYQMGMTLELSYIFLGIGLLLGMIWAAMLTINFMTWRRKRSGVADATRMDVNFGWYAVSLLVILGLAWATLSGYLPALVLPLALFMAIFWAFSFVFAVLTTLRRRAKAK